MILCVLYEIFENIWPATADLLPRAAIMATVAEQPLTDLLSMSAARKDGAGERLRLAIVGMGLVGRGPAKWARTPEPFARSRAMCAPPRRLLRCHRRRSRHRHPHASILRPASLYPAGDPIPAPTTLQSAQIPRTPTTTRFVQFANGPAGCALQPRSSLQ